MEAQDSRQINLEGLETRFERSCHLFGRYCLICKFRRRPFSFDVQLNSPAVGVHPIDIVERIVCVCVLAVTGNRSTAFQDGRNRVPAVINWRGRRRLDRLW